MGGETEMLLLLMPSYTYRMHTLDRFVHRMPGCGERTFCVRAFAFRSLEPCNVTLLLVLYLVIITQGHMESERTTTAVAAHAPPVNRSPYIQYVYVTHAHVFSLSLTLNKCLA